MHDLADAMKKYGFLKMDELVKDGLLKPRYLDDEETWDNGDRVLEGGEICPC